MLKTVASMSLSVVLLFKRTFSFYKRLFIKPFKMNKYNRELKKNPVEYLQHLDSLNAVKREK